MINGMEDVAFLAGIIIGSVLLLSVSWVWVKKQVIGSGGTIMCIVGFGLVGLALWSSITIQRTPDGGLLARFERELQQLSSMVDQVDMRVAEVDGDLRDVVSANIAFSENLSALSRSVESSNRQFLSLTDQLQASNALNREQSQLVREGLLAPGIQLNELQQRREVLENLQLRQPR